MFLIVHGFRENGFTFKLMKPCSGEAQKAIEGNRLKGYFLRQEGHLMQSRKGLR